MIKNKIRNCIAILAASLVAVGCTTDHVQSQFNADSVKAIKTGMAKSDVIAMLGEPRSRVVDNDGGEVWQYRKNAQEGKGVKLFADITSFGITSGTDAEYQDILSVTFKKEIVVKTTYEENVHNLSGLANHN
jgi:outer membrane protein assembly factor BamE (lipoprotein component of BamABCDE complex)